MAVRVRTVLALLILAHVSCALVDDVLEILKFGKEIGEDIINSWDIVGKPFNASGGVELPLFRRRERAVLARMAAITRSIDKVESNIERTSAVLMLLSKSNGKGTRLELRLHEMADLLSRVSAADAKMREYVTLQRDLEKSTLENFAQWCVSHDAGALPSVLDRVHALIAPPHKHLLGRNLFGLVLEDVQDEHPDLCELQMSQHQLIYDMYNTISLAEIKGYAMMQFSWMLLRIYGKGNFTQEASLTRQRYGQRTNQTAAAARAALSLANRELHRCDPAVHKQDVTYSMVTRLLQGYIENEVDLNGDGTCRESCAYYTVAENHDCYKEMFCSKQKVCKGRIIDCSFVESDMWVCQPNNRLDHRRYEWIKYESGRTLGHTDTCSGRTTKVDSWWRWLFWHCSYCMCLCDDADQQSDRYFSLVEAASDVHSNKLVDSWWRWNLHHCSYCFCLCEEDVHDNSTQRFFSLGEALADFDKNKVVTGLRLVKYGRVFHLQISEGTLGERGSVTPGSWVEPMNKFDPDDYDVSKSDYHMLTYEKRAIDLDELESPAGYVMTGARFRMLGAHLHFEIRSTPFNYTTGRLSPERSQWISNDNTDGTFTPRKKLELKSPDIPTRSSVSLPVDSQHDQYLEFTNSDMNKDAAQNTVPFIDIQPVQPLKGAALLSGAGIIHRGVPGSGGYLAAKVITYDFSKHVQAEMPSDEYYHEDDTTDFVPMVS